MVSLHLVRGLLTIHSYTTTTSASMTWECSALTTDSGRTSQINMIGGDAFSSISSRSERTGASAKPMTYKGKDTEESRALLSSQRYTDADTATGTINPTLASSVTPDNAQVAGLFSIRVHYPWLAPDQWRPISSRITTVIQTSPGTQRPIFTGSCLLGH